MIHFHKWEYFYGVYYSEKIRNLFVIRVCKKCGKEQKLKGYAANVYLKSLGEEKKLILLDRIKIDKNSIKYVEEK